MTKLGETLKKLRFKKGMTQGELADAININKASVSNYERGHRNPPYAVLCAMAEVLEVQADELLACVIPEESCTADVAKENQVDSIRQRRIKRILAAFDRLSDDAQLKAVERVEELAMIPAYQRKLADTLQQYIYNRCRIKMEVVEGPLEPDSYVGDGRDYKEHEWNWNVKHITLQHGTEGDYTLCWNFHYFSFQDGNNDEPINDKHVIMDIINRAKECGKDFDKTVFVFDHEKVFDNFYDSYADHYNEIDAGNQPVSESAWAVFLLVDRATWEIKSEQEYNPYE